MGKKLFILFLTLVVILSAFFYPVIATEDEENTEGNGEEVEVGPGGLISTLLPSTMTFPRL